MVTKEEFEELNKKVRNSGIVISRIPQNTRTKFVLLAEKEFAGDYGMTLKSLYDSHEFLRYVISNFDVKLDFILSKLNTEKEQSPEKHSLTMMSGRKVEKEVKKI